MSSFFFAVNKERPNLLKSLDAALSRIQDENRFFNQQMFQKYVSTSGANLFINVEEKAWLAQHGTIRVGYQDDYLAFCARDAHTGELTGALKDYLEHAADCLGNAHLDFEAVAYPSADAAMKALKRGDVVAAVLLGEDLQNREELMEKLAQAQEEERSSNLKRWEKVSVAMGVAVYDPQLDQSVNDTLRRADQMMYENKRLRKSVR